MAMSSSKKTYRKRRSRNAKDFFNLLAITATPSSRHSQTVSMEEKQYGTPSEELLQKSSSQPQTDPSAGFLARCKRALSHENLSSDQPTTRETSPSPQADLPHTMSESKSRSRLQSLYPENQQISTPKTSDQFSEEGLISCLTPPASEAPDTGSVLSPEVRDQEKQGNKGKKVKTDSSDQEVSEITLVELEKGGTGPEQLMKESLSDLDIGLLTPQIHDTFPVKTKTATAIFQASIVPTSASPRQFDEKTIKNILQYVIDESEIIYPYYKQGMLDNKSRPASGVSYVLHLFNDRNVITSPNIDLSFLRVSKTFYQIGVDLFYGSKRFKFYDPSACS